MGRISDVAQPGAWVRADVGGEDIFVMRGEDLALRAFFNVCIHRGTPLLDGDGGRDLRVVCPYHGWTYGTNGLLQWPEGPSKQLCGARVESWGGFLFVCLDEATPSLDAWMGEVPPWLEPDLLRRARRVSYDVAANWKLLVSNFQESHHFPRVHPELQRLTPTKRARSFFPEQSRWLGGEMDIVAGSDTVSISGSLQARPLIVPPARSRVVYDAMLFPSLLTSLQPDYFLTYRLEPRGEAATRVVAETFVHPSIPEDADLGDVYAFWDRVNAQDRWICERQQRGVGSRGFSGPIYQEADEGVVAFERLLREALAS